MGRPGAEIPGEVREAEAAGQGRGEAGCLPAGAGCLQAAAEAAGICLLSAFVLPRRRSLLSNLSLAADQHKVTATASGYSLSSSIRFFSPLYMTIGLELADKVHRS